MASKLFKLSRVIGIAALGLATLGLSAEDNVQQRIVSLDGPITETVFALGKGDQVVAVDVSSTIPAAALRLPKVGYIRQISAEGVLSLQPTLVVASDAMAPKESIELIEGSNVKLTLLKSPETVEDVRENIEKLGDVLEAEEAADALLVKFDVSLEEARAIVSKMEKSPKTIFLMGGVGSWRVAGDHTRANSLIQLAGGENPFAKSPSYQPISTEGLLGVNPDVILIGIRPGMDDALFEAFKKDPHLSLLPAVKNNRVYGVDLGNDLNFGPGLPEAIKSLASKLSGK